MKLKEFAKQHDMKPVDLIALLEKDIAPECDALTDLSSGQAEQAEALLSEPEAPAKAAEFSPFLADVRRHLSAELVVSDRNAAVAQEVARLVDLHQQSGGKQLPSEPSLAALVKEVSDRTKKHPNPWGGRIWELADQVEVINGEVIVPAIEIPPIETVLVDLPSSLEPPLKSAAVPALSAGDDS